MWFVKNAAQSNFVTRTKRQKLVKLLMQPVEIRQMLRFSLIFLLATLQTNCIIIYMHFPEFNKDISKNETHLHLRNVNVQRACTERKNICDSNNTMVCAIRYVNNVTEHREFENSCYLFMSNMCEYPGEEFNIASSTSCEQYLKSRRHSIIPPSTKVDNTKHEATTKAKPILREETTFSTLYDIDSAFDYHICPFSCPDTYSPVCVCVNRGFGQYFKFYTFVNHCEADRYYCKNWEEFSPPPGESENIQSSNLGWSYCGASRYLQFTRFAEATSSMGHYGWLEGDSRFSHIVSPNERKPGYG